MNRIWCAIAAIVVSSAAFACGPFELTKDDMKFFWVTENSPVVDDSKQENLRLWQHETSASIPLKDIEEMVYGSFDARTWEESEASDTIRRNKFYRWIRRNKATDIQEFLTVAKRVERRRAERCSPWYYPAQKHQAGGDYDFASLIECCSTHKNSKLKARYGLQLIRLLHASCQYEQCVENFHKWFDDIPDNHLMKRMAMDYVAGAWSRLGDADKANRYFAMKGDVNSLNGVDDVLSFMASHNPSGYPMERMEQFLFDSSPGYISNLNLEYIRNTVIPAAKLVIKEVKARNLGEWEFLLAYLEGEYNNDYTAADKYIHQAIAHGLSTQTGRDHARAYKMAVDGARGDKASLITDLKWIEEKVKNIDVRDYSIRYHSGYYWGGMRYYWRDKMVGIAYNYWFTYLVEHRELSMAILLCNHIEQVGGYVRWGEQFMSDQEKAEMRKSQDEYNSLDFRGPVIRFMMAQKPQVLINYKRFLNNDNSELVTFLSDGVRRDEDYLNEIIGTLYLQECNYSEAIKWLSKVSSEYQYTLNTYKAGYLTRDPFMFTPESRLDREEAMKGFPQLKNKENIKLNFAKQMLDLEQQTRFCTDYGTRTVAKVKYALARYASFSSCWALTAYQHGWWLYHSHGFHPNIASTDARRERIELEEKKMKYVVESALDAWITWEPWAEIHYLVGDLKAVVRECPDTRVGQFIKKHCDHWKDWI